MTANRLAIVMSLCVLCACQSSRPRIVDHPPTDANFLLPSSFSQQTTVAELKARFGSANVKVIEDSDTNSGWGPSVVLFPKDPTHRAYVSFHDPKTTTGVAEISVRDPSSLWRGKHGVHIGMSLAELQWVNGKSFSFAGFDSLGRGWAHDGWSPALDENDAKLGTLDVGEDEHMYFGVELGLRGPLSEIPADAYPHDEPWVSSDDPRYPRLGQLVVVTGIHATTSLDDEWE